MSRQLARLIAVLAPALFVVAAVLLSVRQPSTVRAQSTTMRISGTVLVYGQPAAPGTLIQVFNADPLAATACASAPVGANGRYALEIGGLVTVTGCLQSGQRIKFLVGGALANESTIFMVGLVQTLNLSVGFATPLPTPIPTPFPTPFPTPVPTLLPTPEPTAFPTPLPTTAPIDSAPTAAAPPVTTTSTAATAVTLAPTPAVQIDGGFRVSGPGTITVEAPGALWVEVYVQPVDGPGGSIIGDLTFVGSDDRHADGSAFRVSWRPRISSGWVSAYAVAYQPDGSPERRSPMIFVQVGQP